MQTITVSDLAPAVGLAARPDVLVFAIGAVVEGQGPARAIPILREASAALLHHLRGVHPAAHVSARRMGLGGGSAEKASKQDRSDTSLEGVVELPLGEAVDFWQRAELAARAIDALFAAALQLSRQKPAVTLGWREPVARIADVETQRARLVEHRRAHLRALLHGSSVDGAPAGTWERVTWELGEVPVDILQVPVSFDEVRLVLVTTDPARRRHG